MAVFFHPSRIKRANASGSDDERLAVFHRVRDEMKREITRWLQRSAIAAEAPAS
jgi:hypothetical protein